MLDLFIDADGCPVKDEIYRVAKRYGLKVYVVANAILRAPASPSIEVVVVKGGLNAADDWIAEHVQADDVVVTSDIPLADRCLQKGAAVLSSNGRPFTDKTIGDSLATRDLMQELRQTGAITGGPSAFRPADRSRFLSALDEIIQRIRRKPTR
jgi:uncharacterized protein YaiI (UPF0178 family)